MERRQADSPGAVVIDGFWVNTRELSKSSPFREDDSSGLAGACFSGLTGSGTMGGLSWSTLNQHCFSQKIPHFASLLKTLVVCVLVGVLEALANFFNTATLGRRGPIISMATKSRGLY